MLCTFDSETMLIQPGRAVPKAVCFSTQIDDGVVEVRKDAAAVEYVLQNDGVIVGHNVSYDMRVYLQAAQTSEAWQQVFRAYLEGRVHCTMLRERLYLNAQGWARFHPGENAEPRYSLAALVARHTGDRSLFQSKTDADSVRYRFQELVDVPVDQWEHTFVDYASDDVSWTRKVFDAQQALADDRWYDDSCRQAFAAFCLDLSTSWGMRTDREMVERFVTLSEEAVEELRGPLRAEGFFKIKRPKTGEESVDQKRVQARVTAAYLRKFREENPWADPALFVVPQTDKGAVKTSREVLLESGDPALALLAECMEFQSLLSKFASVLWRGISAPINPRVNPILVTGRTSYSDPNLQQLPRGGKISVDKMIRESFVPRPGWTFVSSDYDTIELRGLAEVCYEYVGYSNLGDQLAAGIDPHTWLAAKILGMPYEDALKALALEKKTKASVHPVKDARQMSKAANFGFPGGLQATSFVAYAKSSYGVVLTEERAKELRSQWLVEYTEMGPYFSWISQQIHDGSIRQHLSGRVRGDVSFTQAANTMFQGLTADGAKDALCEVTRQCYTDPTSPLYDCRIAVFVHDEIIVEVPPWRDLHDAGYRLAEIMQQQMARWIRRVPITCSPAAMKRWYKDADTVLDACGRLTVWEPRAAA